MMHILILVCSLNVVPQDCTPMTAISAAQGPETNNAAMCGLWGQHQIAGSAIKPQDDEYQKIVCTIGNRVASKVN